MECVLQTLIIVDLYGMAPRSLPEPPNPLSENEPKHVQCTYFKLENITIMSPYNNTVHQASFPFHSLTVFLPYAFLLRIYYIAFSPN